jgi:hypothetical protein
MASETEARRRLPSWWDQLAGSAVPLLAVAAILLYGFLAICYDRFYGSLDVDLNDVGLSYSTTLARSPGLVAAFLIAAGAIRGPSLGIAMLTGDPEKPPRSKIVAVVIAILFVLWLVIWVPLAARGAADDVKAGKPVIPIWVGSPFGRIPILIIRASPAVVEPAGKAGEFPAVERLRGRKLLYLGQANGTVVLYDPNNDAEQVIYLPASSTVLRVSNCDANRSPDPVCKQLDRGP